MSCSSSHPPEKSTILPWHDPRTRTGEKCLCRQNNWKLPLVLQPTPSKNKQSIQEVHPFKLRMSHTSLFKCIRINVISMKKPAWGVESFLYVIHLPDVTNRPTFWRSICGPPWTRLQIQISDPLDVLRWSHHLPLGIANQLHHILSCGGENPCWPS